MSKKILLTEVFKINEGDWAGMPGSNRVPSFGTSWREEEPEDKEHPGKGQDIFNPRPTDLDHYKDADGVKRMDWVYACDTYAKRRFGRKGVPTAFWAALKRYTSEGLKQFPDDPEGYVEAIARKFKLKPIFDFGGMDG